MPVTRLTLPLFFAAALALLAPFAWGAEEPGTVTIHRDEWGVPYIYAATDADAAFGVGYAMAEDRLGDLYENVRTGIGRMAEAFGEAHIEVDYAMRLTKNEARAREAYENAPDELKAILDAFVRGVEAYEAAHPEKRPEWAVDLEPWHSIALGQAMILRWPLGNIQDELRNTRNSNGFGSNQWAVAPERSAEKVPILLTDPHLTWEGLAVFYEAHVFADKLQMQGFFLVGSPLLALGHNGNVGWAATTGGPDTSDIYEMKLNPKNPMQYEYDGEFRNARVEFIQIPVKGRDNPVSRPAGYTHLGPLFAEPDYEKGVAYVGATPYFQSEHLVEQFYRMCLAENADEFYEALGMNEYFEQNVMFADRDGNIQYVRVGRVPIRPEGYDWRKAVPGYTSKTAWTGIHPIEDLVQVRNPAAGYMQNCNISPANMMKNSPMTPDKYRDYIYNVSWDDMNTRGMRALSLLSSDENVTKEEAMAFAFDVYDVLAVPWQLALTRALEDPEAQEAVTPEIDAAAKTIAAWDGNFTKDSEAAPIVRYWRKHTERNVDLNALVKSEPLSSEEYVAVVQGLGAALAEMKSTYGTRDLVWGDIHKVGRSGKYFPVGGTVLGGGSTHTRTLFNVGGRDTGDGIYVANNGSMSMVLMFFYPERVETYTCIPWGQNADPESPHHMDQGEKLYSQRKFKKIPATREELLESVTRTIELETR